LTTAPDKVATGKYQGSGVEVEDASYTHRNQLTNE
jgi:hypothetical protein